MMFHRHRFVEKQRVFAPRRSIDIERWSGSEMIQLIKEMAFGVTTIIRECECSKVETIRVLGDGTEGTA